VKKTYIQDPESGEFVEKRVFQEQQHAIHVMQTFVSPIDGSVIRDPAQLRSHNAKHGVTDTRDYGPEWFNRKRDELEAKRQGIDPASKKERIQALIHATHNYNRR
jgi:hypothetical protein